MSPPVPDPPRKSPSRSPNPSPRRRVPVLSALARLFELALIGLGIAFSFVIEGGEASAVILLWWVLLAFVYLLGGGLALRRSRLSSGVLPAGSSGILPARSSKGQVGSGAPRHRWRFNFLFGVIASITGLTTAFQVAVSTGTTELELTMESLGSVAMVFSWLLLHAGYARRYEQLYAVTKRGGGGLQFPHPVVESGPGTEPAEAAIAPTTKSGSTDAYRPTSVDFLYFAFSIGATFSSSDVTVTTSRMRWHVMTHSIVSFFYNAAVVAFAISVLRGG